MGRGVYLGWRGLGYGLGIKGLTMTTVIRSGSFVEFHVAGACVEAVNLPAEVGTYQDLDIVAKKLERHSWFAGEARERFLVICLSWLNVY